MIDFLFWILYTSEKHLYIFLRCIIITINLTDSKLPRRPRPMLAFPFPCFFSVSDQTVRSGLNPMKSQDKINLPSLRLLLLGDLVMEMRCKPCTAHRDVLGRCWAWAWSRLEDHGVQEGIALGEGREGMSRNKSTVQSYCFFCPHHKTCQSLPCVKMYQE